jgi:heat shock protein beta
MSPFLHCPYEGLMDSDKHSTFSTTFPIYILERSTKDIPIAPKTPVGDGPDELEDDLESDDQSEKEVKTKYEWVSEWIRVNDKAPIWMR